MAIKKVYELAVDLKRTSVRVNIPVLVQGDSAEFRIRLLDNGAELSTEQLTGITSVKMQSGYDAQTVIETVGTLQGSVAVFRLKKNELFRSGTVQAMVQLEDTEDRISTLRFQYQVIPDLAGNYIPGEQDITVFQRYMNDAQAKIDEINAAAEVMAATDVAQLTVKLADKASKQDLQQVSLSFKESYASLSALQSAYPSGDAYNHAVLSNGLIYTYASNAWTSTGIQANGTGIAERGISKGKIATKSVGVNEIDFVEIGGKNLFNKNTATLGYIIDPNNGTISANANYYLSDYIPVKASTQYFRGRKDYATAFYDSGFNLISHTVGVTPFTTPANAAYMRVTTYITTVDTLQVEEGAVATAFELPKIGIPNLAIYKEKTADYDKYPFQANATLKDEATRNILRSAIKRIEINGADTSKKYALGIIQRNYVTYGTGIYIAECNDDGSYKRYVAMTVLTSYTIPTGIALFNVADVYNLGITAKVWIDWNEVPNNTQHITNTYALGGLDARTFELSSESEVALTLPTKYELVVGDTFELFYKGLVLANNPFNYYIEVVSTKGKPYSKRFVFTPAAGDVGTHTLKINVYDDNRALLAAGQTNLIVKAKAANPSTVKTVLNIGDSLTVNGEWVNELKNRVVTAENLTNVSFIGTQGTSAKFEGYGGWRYSNYLTDFNDGSVLWINGTHDKTEADQHSIYQHSNGTRWKLETIEAGRIKVIRTTGTTAMPTSGTLTWVSGGTNTGNIVFTLTTQESGNPFWNEATGAVDFANYAAEIGVASIDFVNILLGWNSTFDTEATYKANVRSFINEIRADFPNAKITLIGLHVPSKDGLGHNYGADGGWQYFDKMKFIFNLDRWHKEVAAEFTNVDVINVSGQFDSENNIQTGTRAVNVRNSKTETYGINGVHPALEGYYQYADAVYRNLSHKI